MTVAEYAKYVVDNMYRASLANSLNISKKLVNFSYPINLVVGNNTKEYEFSDFLAEIDGIVSDYLDNGKMNRVTACKVIATVAKYRNMLAVSYKGASVYGDVRNIFSDEGCTEQILPIKGRRYYITNEKKSYDYNGEKFVPVKLINYQMFMLVDSFIMELWECYQNGH